MIKFTVVDTDFEPIARHLSAAEAAHIILTADGRDYAIRPTGDGGFVLWTRQQVANRLWAEPLLFSGGRRVCFFADTLAEAEAEIFAAVIRARWPRHPEAMTDAEFDEIAAEA